MREGEKKGLESEKRSRKKIIGVDKTVKSVNVEKLSPY
jgi:hypothetical protein